MRALGFDPVHDTRRTFDGLLEAMSRPGTVRHVPSPADYAVVSTLVDHEVTLATDDDALRDALSGQGRLDAAPPETADIVHVHEFDRWDVRECKRGSPPEPSNGATIVYRVDTVAGGTREDCATATLTGPGVDGTETLSASLPPAELSALVEAQSGYPRGVDAVLAGDGCVAALPRSVSLEVV